MRLNDLTLTFGGFRLSLSTGFTHANASEHASVSYIHGMGYGRWICPIVGGWQYSGRFECRWTNEFDLGFEVKEVVDEVF